MKIKTITSPDQLKTEKEARWIGYGIINIPPHNILNGRFVSFKEDTSSYHLSFIEEGKPVTIEISKEMFQKGLVIIVFENDFSNGPL